MCKFMETNNVIISLSLIFNQYEHRGEMLSEIQPLYILLVFFGQFNQLFSQVSRTLVWKAFPQVGVQTGGGLFFSNPSLEASNDAIFCTLVNEKINMIFAMPSCVFLALRNSQKENFKSYVYQ